MYDSTTASLSGGAYVTSEHAGYYGAGFVDITTPTDEITWTVTGCTAGTHTVSIGYALGGGNRPLDVVVNGVT
eukprot:56672_4